MFLRKLTVMLLPLAGLAAVISLRGWLTGLGFWGDALLGLVCGVCLALLPKVAGARRGRIPFARQLLVPAGLLIALLIVRAAGVPEPADPVLPAAGAALACALLVTGIAG